MRLIDAFTLELREFPAQPPEYAILSHTWGDEEVSFQEFASSDRPVNKKGYTKIVQSCALMSAEKPNQKFMWIDTCCIDKSSSAELSESINSMFRWYRDATACYAYLEDVSKTDPIEAFRRSRWFTRGWTLQELIAPSQVKFLTKEWEPLGSRRDLANEISTITSIDADLLRGTWSSYGLETALNSFSVSTRMSWAGRRNTTRVEDIAYCLMGLFNVNMPLLYGEGRRAFLRLQEEIVKIRNDQSILAWHSKSWTDDQFSPFAPYPDAFEQSVDITLPEVSVSMSLDSRGLSLDLQLIQLPQLKRYLEPCGHFFAILQGHLSSDYLIRPMINVEEIPEVRGMFRREPHSPIYWLESRIVDEHSRIYVSKLRDRSDGVYLDDLAQIDHIGRKRIILGPLGGQQYMNWTFLSPPLNITTSDFRVGEPNPVHIKMAIPPVTSEAKPIQNDSPLSKSESVIFQRHSGTFPALETTKSDVSMCFCGALCFEYLRHSFVLIWGFNPETPPRIEEIYTQQLSSVKGSPFVLLRTCEDIHKEGQLMMSGGITTGNFRYLISSWLSYGPENLRSNDLKDSSTLDIGDDSTSVSASIKRLSFLDRTRYHLSVEIRHNPEGVKYRRWVSTRPKSRFEGLWD